MVRESPTETASISPLSKKATITKNVMVALAAHPYAGN